MSKGSLQSFEYKIKREDSIADGVKNEMQHISKSILDVMNDRVGENANISINRICDVFTTAAESVISKSENAARMLETGYEKINGLSLQGEKLVSNAKGLMRALGDL